MSSALKYGSKLQGHRVLIVGGSSGMGYAVGEAALEHGADVILSGSSQTRLDAAVSRLRAYGKSTGLPEREVLGKTCNLSDAQNLEGNIQALLEAATAGKTKLLDHVVYTAGDALDLGGVRNATVESIAQSGLVRTTAVIILAKHLPDYMHNTVRSSLTLTGGVVYRRPAPGWAVMNGTCGGIEALTRGLAVELKPLRVNCVQPGAIRTELFDKIPEPHREAAFKMMQEETITNTVGRPDEIAEAYLYLMRATFTTATVVPVEGGKLVGDSKPGLALG